MYWRLISELSASDEDSTWISWFVTLRGNEFFCEVREENVPLSLQPAATAAVCFLCTRIIRFPAHWDHSVEDRCGPYWAFATREHGAKENFHVSAHL